MTWHKIARTPKQAAKEYAESIWSCSGGELDIIVQIVVYADESGMHDASGKETGAEEGIIAGIAAPKHVWIKFCAKWQSILDSYKAPFFHFVEWTSAEAMARGKHKLKPNPYSHLDSPQMNAMLMELAKCAVSGGKVIFGGRVPTAKFNAAKLENNPEAHGNPYHRNMATFFESYLINIRDHQPDWERHKVNFVLDDTGDGGWKRAFGDAFSEARKNNPRFSKYTFSNTDDDLPLQAADLLAYRARRVLADGVRYLGRYKYDPWPELDNILFAQQRKLLERKIREGNALDLWKKLGFL